MTVAIAYVHDKEVAHSFQMSIEDLVFHDLQNEGHLLGAGNPLRMRYGSGGLIAARNHVAQKVYDDQSYDWLFWIDSDMGFEPDSLDRLLAVADPDTRPIVGGLCFAMNETQADGYGGYTTRPSPTIYDWYAERKPRGFVPRVWFEPNALTACDGTGSAFILIHRSVLEKIHAENSNGNPKWCGWYDQAVGDDGVLASEDLSFCMRAKTAGAPIYVHTGVRTTHMKTVWLGEPMFWERQLAPPATEQTAVLVPVMKRPQNAEPFMQSLRASTGLATAYAIYDEADTDTRDAWKAAGAQLIQSSGPSFATKINDAYRATSEPWMFLTGDDVRFHPGWLDHTQFAATITEAGVVGTNDLANPRVLRGEHATHLLIRRSYVDEQGASWDGPGVVCHEGYRHWFCNPPEAPIWMADLSFKSLGEVRVGDEVVGWQRVPSGSMTLNELCVSEVLKVAERDSALVRVTMESGRAFTCTPDHRWLNPMWTPAAVRRWPDYPEWVTPAIDRQLLHVVDETPPVPTDLERLAGWVGGIYDGEGSWIQISQCPIANPEIHAAISVALNKLDIPHTVGGPTDGGHFLCLTGGRQAYVDFLNKCQPIKRWGIQKKIIGGKRFGQRDRIVSVEPAGSGTVLSMTTTTGNYVAWGYASRNCDDELVTAAKQRGVWSMALASRVEHLHPLFGKGENDETYRIGQLYAQKDKKTFEKRLKEHAA